MKDQTIKGIREVTAIPVIGVCNSNLTFLLHADVKKKKYFQSI